MEMEMQSARQKLRLNVAPPKFQEIADCLRKALREVAPPAVKIDGTWMEDTSSLAARAAVVAGERELTARAISYLFDHLINFEQFREAAQLLVWAMPHVCKDHPSVIACAKKALSLAEKMETPEAELLNSGYLALTHEAPDEFVQRLDNITTRGAYWLQVSRLIRAKNVMEWGTGCGSNVTQLASVYTDTNWYGLDQSYDQAKANEAQAARLGIKCTWLAEPAVEYYGKMDCVAVLDCLEHTVYPDCLLDKAEKYLRPGGTMVISVPNGPWSLHTPNSDILLDSGRAGNHVAVGSPLALIQYLSGRGWLIDVRVLATGTAEGNSSLLCAYEPYATMP